MKAKEIPEISSEELFRFLARINKRGPLVRKGLGKCFSWKTDGPTDIYGSVYLSGEEYPAHRVAWTIENGPIPRRLRVLHKCDNKNCVNPAHLFLGTQGDNMRDRSSKGRGNHPRGDQHPARLNPSRLARGEAHGQSKLVASDVISMRAKWASGESLESIGRSFRVSGVTAKRAILGITWAHV